MLFSYLISITKMRVLWFYCIVAFFFLCIFEGTSFPHIPTLDSPYQTIVIIYGQLRTFDSTCPSIKENVLQPNSPVKIVFSFDTNDNITFSSSTIACLQPFWKDIDFLVGKIPHTNLKLPHGIEFQVINRAIDHILQNNISAPYMIKLRTDNAILDRVYIPPLFGSPFVGSTGLAYQFLRFQHEYNEARKRENFPVLSDNLYETYNHRLWAYLFTAGMPRMISPMLFHPSPSKWSFINATSWNKNLKETVDNLREENETSFDSLESLGELLENNLRIIHQHHKILYLIGRTWIEFGRFSDIVYISRQIMKDYGYLGEGSGGWNVSDAKSPLKQENYAWPFTGAKLIEEQKRYNTFEWREVTESQLRLVHWNGGYNLIDMVNAADDLRSFGEGRSTFLNDIYKSAELVGFILRKY